MRAKKTDEVTKRKFRTPYTAEARESQLISLATDLAEKQLREGTASSQVITHYLRLGSIKEKVELEMLKEQKKLIQAKTESLQSAKHIEELYAKAMQAFGGYRGEVTEQNDEELQ